MNQSLSTPHSFAADLQSLRKAQGNWSSLPFAHRCQILKKLPALLESQAESLHGSLEIHHDRSLADTIASELMPLATATKWICRHGTKILESKGVSHRGLNLFLGRLSGVTVRDPFGVVFVVGPWNYPFFLTGMPTLQALFAGNAVVCKPAIGCELATRRMFEAFVAAGVPKDLFKIVDSKIDSVANVLAAGVDLVVLTASSTTGRIVAAEAAKSLTPMIAELSGCDAMVVLEDADLARVVDAICFGLRLNGSATCMAPRRLIATPSTIDALLPILVGRVQSLPAASCTEATAAKVQFLVQTAERAGATCVIGKDNEVLQDGVTAERPVKVSPIVLDNVLPSMEIAGADIFAPVISLLRLPHEDGLKTPKSTNTDERILAVVDQCPYALSASIFGDAERAMQLAKRMNVGFVCINDIFAPSVEPSIGFGGRRASGYGTTRGVEGLRQMTREKSIVVRRGNFLPHLQSPTSQSDSIVRSLFKFQFAKTFGERLAGLRTMIKAGGSPKK